MFSLVFHVTSIAAQPLHWVYETDAMQKALEGLEYPEFRSTSANPYYCIPTGLQSPYGDQLITMLESLVASNGKSSTNKCMRGFITYVWQFGTLTSVNMYYTGFRTEGGTLFPSQKFERCH